MIFITRRSTAPGGHELWSETEIKSDDKGAALALGMTPEIICVEFDDGHQKWCLDRCRKWTSGQTWERVIVSPTVYDDDAEKEASYISPNVIDTFIVECLRARDGEVRLVNGDTRSYFLRWWRGK